MRNNWMGELYILQKDRICHSLIGWKGKSGHLDYVANLMMTYNAQSSNPTSHKNDILV